MARLLLQLAEPGDGTTAGAVPLLLLLLLVAAAVAAVVVSICTSSKNAKQKWAKQRGTAPGSRAGSFAGGKKQLLASLSDIGGKAAAVAKMVSWNRRSGERNSSDDDVGDQLMVTAVGKEDGEEALWKKTIIMGDKCRPLEFSGQIAFDSDGNQLPAPPPQAPAAAAELVKKSAAHPDVGDP